MTVLNVAYLGTFIGSRVKDTVYTATREAANYTLGKKTVGRIEIVTHALKLMFLKKIGYYNRITDVYLHRGRDRTDVTRTVKRIDPVVAKSSFITPSAFFFHEMSLDQHDVLEVHGLDDIGNQFKFVLDWDSEVAVPLMNNVDNDKLVDKSICSAQAVYAGVSEDITSLVRKWTRCCPIERTLPYIGRDYFNESDKLFESVMEASDDDRFEIHVLYSDMTSRKMVYEKPARLLINL